MNKACPALFQSLGVQVEVHELIQSIVTNQKPSEFENNE